MNFAADLATYAAHSDLACASKGTTAAFIWDLGAYSLAHYAMGLTAALLVVFKEWSPRVFWVVLAFIIAKELYGDIANAGGSRWVVTDTIWDIFCYFFGFVLVWGLAGLHHKVEGVQ